VRILLDENFPLPLFLTHDTEFEDLPVD